MIFYFTGTGNSLYAAKTLGEAIGEDIHNITEYSNDNDIVVGKGEVLGFVFPVYYYSLPTVVEEFLENIRVRIEKGGRTFVLATCGATTGDSTRIASEILKKKGIDTDFIFAVEMPDNYVLMYDVQDVEKQQKIIENSRDALDEAISAIDNDHRGNHNEIKGPMPGMMTAVAGAIYKRGRKTVRFYSSDTCTGCNLCEKICPAGAIRMENKRPVWIKDQCVHCLACIHRCPVKAIQYGKKTESRGRYINPYSGL